MKLKTLKETATEEEMAEYFEDIKEFDVKRITRVVKGNIRQSTIKDIKFFRKNRSSNPEYSKEELNGVEKYIKWKFNVEEGDLK